MVFTGRMQLSIAAALVVCVCLAYSLGLESGSSPSVLSRSPSTASTLGRHDFPLASTSGSKVIKCDRYYCNCNGEWAKCSGGEGRKVYYLPRLPAKIRKFRMMRENLRNLTRSMLANLSNFEIKVMNLTFNNISLIENDAFADFPKLVLLDLSGNPIPMPELRVSLRSITSRSLTTIALGKMGLTFLPDDFFDMFQNRTFKKVDLQQNHLISFNSAVISTFWKVENADFSKNQIFSVNMTGKINIKKLILKENNFQEFPDLCLHRSPETGETGHFSAFFNLLAIFISNNPIRRINPSVLRGTCFPHLIKLDISLSTFLVRLENNFIADLPRLENLMVNHMTELRTYERHAFNSSVLRILSLRGNRVLTREVVDIGHVFSYCPNLEELSIVDTKLDMDSKELYALMIQLTSVKYLSIQRVRVGTIPENLLWRLPNLEKLIFAGNNVNSDGLARALKNVTTLQQLNVQANSITVVNETTLPWEFRRSVTWLEISQNPFTCTCELLWFRRWLDDVTKNGSVKVNNFPSQQYYCATPIAMKGVFLSDFHPTEELCAIKNPYIIISIVGGCLLTGLVGLFVLIYRYRWYLRFYLYRLRRRHKYIQFPGGVLTEGGEAIQIFPFDAYLAHSTRDLDWIFEELLPLLEGEHGLKIFTEERDGTPGAVIANNIEKYMDESARVLLLISDNYLREGWGQYEFENIVYAAIEQHKDVIVILLGDVEAGWMTRDMRRILTRGTFLQWKDSEEAKRVFREGLRVALRTQNVDLQTLC